MNNNNYMLPFIKENVALNKNNYSRAKTKPELKHKFQLHQGFRGIRSVNVTSDNRYLIITFENNKGWIRVLDLKKLEYVPNNYFGHTDSVRLTSITKDNKAFYTASWDGTSRRFDIASGKCTQIFSGFGRSPSCFLDQEQKYLFTASYDTDHDLEANNTGRCWDITLEKTINWYKHTLERYHPESIDIAYEDGKVYTGSDDGIAYKWNLKGEKPILKFFEFEGSVRKVAISTNFFAAACTDGFVRIHKKFSGKYFRYLFHGDTDVLDIRISKDETKLWSAAEDGSISCFNLLTGDLIYHKNPHSLWIWSICLMNDEKILVTGSSDGSIAFLSTDSGQVLAQLLNVTSSNELLIACPPDKTFPTGFFYTTKRDFIKVIEYDKKRGIQKKLDLDDPRREAYINKLNLKNLVMTRLKNNGHYSSLTKQINKNQKLFFKVNSQKLPRLLRV